MARQNLAAPLHIDATDFGQTCRAHFEFLQIVEFEREQAVRSAQQQVYGARQNDLRTAHS